MTMIIAIFLGLIQGITEFLPVSSSGHLTLFGNWLGTRDEDVVFELLLHLGTLLATVIVFREIIMHILKGLIKREKESIQISIFILLTTIVTAVIGKLFEKQFESLFSSIPIVSVMLIITGSIIYLPKIIPEKSEGKKLNITKAILIGMAQSIAIIPGISRSGTTISCCLLLGLSRQKAGEYSFLISIPIIAGASLAKLPSLNETTHHFSLFQMGAGVLFAFISGLFALKFLMSFVKMGKLHYFSWYCWILGLFGLTSQILY